MDAGAMGRGQGAAAVASGRALKIVASGEKEDPPLASRERETRRRIRVVRPEE
jgi:hypothetical protein